MGTFLDQTLCVKIMHKKFNAWFAPFTREKRKTCDFTEEYSSYTHDIFYVQKFTSHFFIFHGKKMHDYCKIRNLWLHQMIFTSDRIMHFYDEITDKYLHSNLIDEPSYCIFKICNAADIIMWLRTVDEI